ncbi:uncharacterized protein LOC114435379 [Parambassis ranga]|uniref:Uncharacterized protein LOC114435379 n=1 Tax=Parambassis ranga TaxID=210632 RepID=A0A6P7I4L5_9TELE|nr:uncharacterized protein LOC114435379 [Parambassis ranga]XP_028260843.1 uncharacterized protein LOC114435379 [Parambassis ranga]XP_028260844.1 uncharacterized protein LOC114435379 [Parambassis ranga]XP_028260845.1 uncharacterized protein LOC114435379 [Parambassis ranga]XP_028260846.1 uncharacterized protein LOC114435379 [Parambassis ranga]XP_028260847.1 uncharacterized protein LOC114435379 [Parambassis ranga]XP_028260848.1 uncharacterized protein LOC114435379 [Parambassis ranga]XP_02826084
MTSQRKHIVCSLLLLLFITSHVTAFEVNVTQSDYNATVNHSITLEWTFPTNTSTSHDKTSIACDVIAEQKSYIVYQAVGGVEVPHTQDERFSGRVQSDTDALREGRLILHLSRLRTEDSGLYVCDVGTNHGGGSAVTQLNVTPITPLTVKVTQSSYQAEENHTITLEWAYNSTGSAFEELDVHCSHLAKPKELVLYQVYKGVERPEFVDGCFSGRVQSDTDALREGRIRLHLSRLRKNDSGQHKCAVRTCCGYGFALCDLNITAAVHRPTERPTPSPQPDTGGRTGLSIGLIAAVVLVLCVIFVIVRMKGHSDSQSVCNSRTRLFQRELQVRA